MDDQKALKSTRRISIKVIIFYEGKLLMLEEALKINKKTLDQQISIYWLKKEYLVLKELQIYLK